MSILNEYRSTKEALQELEQRAAELEQSNAYKAEREFDEMLRALMVEYNKSLRDIVALVDPSRLRAFTGEAENKKQRKQRGMKRYTNPHTGEVVETRGGNHKDLRQWRERWGKEAVESWGV